MKLLAIFLPLLISSTIATAAEPAWVKKSNAIAEEYTHYFSKIYPELGSSFGLREYDSKGVGIVDDMEAKDRAALKVWQGKLEAALAKESDPNLKIDLEIMQDMVGQMLAGMDIDQQLSAVPVALVARDVYGNIFGLVNPQSPAERKAAAVDRFKAYVDGFETYKPYAVASESRTRAYLSKAQGKTVHMPLKQEIEKYLEESPAYVSAVRDMLGASGRKGWEPTFETFAKQVAAYDAFVKAEILPKARTDYRLPVALYAHTLKTRGIDASPDWLIKTGRQDFETIYKEFEALAKKLSEKNRWTASAPADVIKQLKAKQVTKASDVEALYKKADLELKAIIEKHALVDLPKTPLKIRLADDAESKANPVPHLNPPPIIGNTGERPEFVVPTSSSGELPFDDFSYEAAALVLTAHEGRPGHDLQFSSMLDGQVSHVRARYAFNNVNVEGWGLYAEDLVYPYLPEEAQLVALQTRLWRVARLFLDPEVQTGRAQPKDVEELFVKRLGVSPRMAKLEVERYTFDDPGQAPAYYYGLLKLRSLRDELGIKSGPSLKCFNDTVLSLGLLPMDKAAPLVAAAGCEKRST